MSKTDPGLERNYATLCSRFVGCSVMIEALHPVELGLHTFGDVTADSSGNAFSHAHVIRDVVAEGVLADRVGIDFFGVGEHHRADFAVSAPEVVTAAIAAQTSHIRLGSAATVLTSDDPVRVFQRFSTLNAVSNGRAEMIVGRGWFAEPLALFGCEVSSADALFEEKLDLLVALTQNNVVTWNGSFRSAIVRQRFYPSTDSKLKISVAVGSSPESTLRIARHGLPMIVAAVGGEAERFKPLVDLYRLACKRLGRSPEVIGVHSVGYISNSDEEARERLWPAYFKMRERIGSERGWLPYSRMSFDTEIALGSLYVGSPETVARKIASTMTTLGATRFDLRYSVGDLPHEAIMRSIELYGTKVVPLVKKLLRKETHPARLVVSHQ